MKTKSILFTALLTLCLGLSALAQAPQGFTYQAVARTAGNVLNNQTIDVRFTILQGNTGVYTETHNILTNQYGLFTLEVGDGLTNDTFSSINWSAGNFSLRVEIDPNQGGTPNFVNMGTTRLLSVPYSLYAEKAGSVDNVAMEDLSNVIAPVPDSGDVLKWDGTNWVSSPDQGGTIYPGTGINIINDTIFNTGDADPSDDIIIGSLAGGDLTGTYPDPTIAKLQGRDISSQVPADEEVLKWNATSGEWEPSPDNVASGGSGAVNTTSRISGDGSIPLPLDIAQQGATLGQVLKWNGTSWSPDNDGGTQDLLLNGTILTLSPGGGSVNLPFTSYSGGPGINIAGSVISNTGDTLASDDIIIGFPASGDLTGSYPSPTVARIRNTLVSSATPFANQVLKFNNGQWIPSTDEINDPDSDPNNEIQSLSISGTTLTLSNGGGTVALPTYFAGPGINITGSFISNIGDINAADDITIGSTAGGDLGGTYPNPVVTKIHGRNFANTAPNNSYVYKWDQNNSQWIPAPDEFTDADADPTNELQTLSISGNTLTLSGGGGSAPLPVYSGGTGINIIGNTIFNTGDTNPNDDILIGSLAGGDLGGTYPNPDVVKIQGRQVSNNVPNIGEGLEWNGTQWAPALDNIDDADASPSNELQSLSISGNTLSLSLGGGSVAIPIYSAGQGISINGSNVVTNTGDLNPSDDVLIGSAAGGDLGGSYPNPDVVKLQGNNVSNSIPSSLDVLKWNGVQWTPAADAVTDPDSDPTNELQTLIQSGNTISLSMGGGSVNIPVYTGGSGIVVSGTVINNTGDLNPNDDILIGSAASGDLDGSYPNPEVVSLQGHALSNSTPNPGDVLKWNGSQWEPDTDEFIDGDNDPNNEIQNLSLSGTTISLTSGGSVVLPYTAGTGINLNGAIINNTGDTNAADDITIGSAAGGDLDGTYPDPTVVKLQGFDLSTNTPNLDQVLKWDGSQWTPSIDEFLDPDSDPANEIQQLTLSGTTLSLSQGGGSVGIPIYTAGTGIDITGNIVTNTGDLNPNDDITINTPAGGDLTGFFPSPTISSLSGFPLSNAVPNVGEVLGWNGTQWIPSTDENTTYSAGTGLALSGTVFSNTGDTDASDDITNSTTAGGDLDGTYPNPSVVQIQGNPISVNTPSQGEVLKWSGSQWIPSADSGVVYTGGTGIDVTGSIITNTGDTDASDDITTSSLAGGDAAGIFSNLNVTGLQGNAVDNSIPLNGEVLKWNGSAWAPAGDVGIVYSGGPGIDITSNFITNTGDIDASDDITNTTVAGGDLSGLYPNPIVSQIQGNAVASGTPASAGLALKWDGFQWAAAADDNTTYTSGTGINIAGTVINNTGDTNAADDVTIGSAAGGDLAGTYPNPTVSQIQGSPVSAALPSSAGQILKWDGFQWALNTDANTTYNAGSGIDITGNTITNLGDTDGSDDITNTTVAGGDLNGTYPNPTVDAIQGSPISITSPTSAGQVLVWDGFQWGPGADANTVYTAGAGIDVTGTVITNLGDIDGSDDITNSTTAGGDLDGTYPDPTVAALQGNAVSTATPGTGEVLKWNGTQWAPASDAGTTYSAGSGIDITGTVVTNTGDTDASDDLTNISLAGGDVSGFFSNMTVERIQGAPVSVVNPTISGQVLRWDGTQWSPGTDANDIYTAGSGIDITGNVVTNLGDTDGSDDITNTTTAGGDLDGTYPNPTVAALQGTGVSTTAPTVIGQVLKWDGTEWAPGADGGNTYTAGTGIDVTGTVITNTGDTDASDDITTSTLSGGDVSGFFPNLTVTSLQGSLVDPSSPAINQILKWNGSQWNLASDVNTTYTGGTGIDVTGTVVTNTGDTDPSNDITNTTTAGGDLSGTYPNPIVARLQTNPVSSATPASGEVLKWDGLQWAPAADGGNTYTGGTGIDITGTVVTNTGDTDASDDITTSTVAGGDVTGTFPNLAVDGLRGNPISVTPPSFAGQTLEWNGTEWAPATDDNTTYTAGTGLDLTGTVFSNTGDTDASDDITTSTNAGGDVSGPFSNLNVAAIQGNPVSSVAPSSVGQILKWDGFQWVVGSDNGANYTAGSGIDVTGTVITNTGDTDGSDDITNSTTAGGDLSGTYPNPTVDALQGSPVAATAPSSVGQVLKWDGGQWAPGSDDINTYTSGSGIDVTGTVITNTGDTDGSDDITNSTTAGGDLSGTYPNPTVDALQGSPVAATAPSLVGQVLKWDGGQWAPGSDDGTTYTAGSGIDVTGTVITNTGDTDASDDLTTSSTAGGDASGVFSNLTVVSLQNSPVSSSAPTISGQVLKWNGTAWAPGTDDGANYTGGTGIDVTGTLITNTGDTDASDDITNVTVAGGDLSGTYPNPTVDALQGNPVSSSAPISAGQVLRWDGLQWAPGTDENDVYTAGTGIDITGNVVTNTGDTDGSDDITNSTIAGGDLNGTYPNPTVDALQGTPVSLTAPTVMGQVLRWDGTQWGPGTDEVNDGDSDATNEIQTLSVSGSILSLSNGGGSVAYPPSYTAGTGIALSGTTIINIGDTDASDDITNGSTAGGDLSGTYPNPTVASLQGTAVSATAPTVVGQVLEWDGAEWVPGTDDGVLYGAGAGIDITGNVITNTGDQSSTNEIQTLSISGTTISLSNGGSAVALPYTAGAGIDITGVFVTNTGDTDASDDITTATVAGGDLTGTYPNPTVDALQGYPVSATAPTTIGQVLRWNGSLWVPGTDANDIYTAGAGIDITGNVVANTGDTDASDDITTATVAGGDLSGSFPNPTVDALQGTAVSATAPTVIGQVLQWNGVDWAPGTDAVDDADADATNEIQTLSISAGNLILSNGGGSVAYPPTYTAGTGIDLTGNAITNTGDTDASDDITTATVAAGDLSGTYPNPTVGALQGTAVSSTAPTVTGQVLKYDGTEWAAGTDSFNVYTASTGIDVTGTVITNTGDTDASDDITTATVAAGDLSGTYPNPTVASIQGTGVSATTPDNSEYLRYDGANWVADTIVSSDLVVDADILPTDQTYNLGGASNLWLEVFAFNGLINTSDIREKENIDELEYGLDEILKLRPVSYSWIKKPELGTKLGLIAQEVKPIIGEVVKTHQQTFNPVTGKMEDKELDRFGINYTDLIPVIVKGMQEQQTAMDKQNELIEVQQTTIELLEERIKQLESKLK